MKNLFWTAICLSFVSISCTQEKSLTRDEVIAAIEKFDAGWKAKSRETTDSILAPAYIYFTQSGGIFDRKNVLNTAASPKYTLEQVERKIVDTRITGNTAVVNTTWIGKGVYFDKPFNDTQRCSVTLIKEKGKVTILSEHCTLIK